MPRARSWHRRAPLVTAAAAAAVLLAGCASTTDPTVTGTVTLPAAPITSSPPPASELPSAAPSPSASASAPAASAPGVLDAAGGPGVGGGGAAAPAPGAGPPAAVLLATLPIKGRAAKTGYSRDQFGQAWADVDRNGCDTRNDILHRDLTAVVTKPGTRECVVLSGSLADPYSATVIAFTRGEQTSSTVQIDHVVALSDAWQKGAQQATPASRQLFANDPLNLLAVDGSLNQQKGDGDAATWLPPNKGFRCAYVARQVAVKAKYRLWVTQAEHDAIASILASCPGQQVPVDDGAPLLTAQPTPAAGPSPTTARAPAPPSQPATKPAAPAPTTRSAAPPASTRAPVPPPPPVTTPAPPAAGVYYANCAAVRAAGKAPLLRGQPGYRPPLDRDGDGIACEK